MREACTIPGTSRAHGLAVPRQAVDEGGAARGRRPDRGLDGRRRTSTRCYAFADAVGYPLILKPRTGAGALGHHPGRQPTPSSTRRWARSAARASSSIAVEEFVEGHEGFYDTLSIDGDAALDFVCHYYPNVLEAMRTRWISPQFVATNRVDRRRDYQRAARAGPRGSTRRSASAPRATHMEWFFGPKGLRFSEIGCRPAGVGAWDLYSAGNDIDLYRAWADAIVHGHVGASPIAAVRRRDRRAAPGPATGTSPGYSGVDEMQAAATASG